MDEPEDINKMNSFFLKIKKHPLKKMSLIEESL